MNSHSLHSHYRIGEFTLDTRLCRLSQRGRTIPLQPLVFRFLVHLARNRDRVVSKRELMEHLWPDRIVAESSLYRCVTAARRALEDRDASSRVIQNLYGRGFRLSPAGPVATVGACAPERPPFPALAVLPFSSSTARPSHQALADELSEDLATRLTQCEVIPVISRNGSFQYRDGDARRAGRELGAHYVLRGTLRGRGSALRVTAHLCETDSQREIWGERFDADIRDLCSSPGDLASGIAARVYAKVVHDAGRRASRRDPRRLGAWEWMLQGLWRLTRGQHAENVRARRCFQKALSLDPGFSAAHAWIAHTYYEDLVHGWSASAGALCGLRAHATDCLREDPESGTGHMVQGLSLYLGGEPREATESLVAATRSHWNPALAHSTLGMALSLEGRSESGLVHLERALRSSPCDATRYRLQARLALGYFAAGQFADAVSWAKTSLRSQRSFSLSYGIAASASALLGELPAASRALERFLAFQPGFGQQPLHPLYAAASPRVLSQFLDGLRRAGLPRPVPCRSHATRPGLG